MGNDDEERVNLLGGYQINSSNVGGTSTSYSASAPNYQDGMVSYQDSAPPYEQINNQYSQRPAPPPGPYYNPQYATVPVAVLPQVILNYFQLIFYLFIIYLNYTQVILVGGCPCCRYFYEFKFYSI